MKFIFRFVFLKIDQAANNHHIIFHPVIDFIEQDFLLMQGNLQLMMQFISTMCLHTE